MDEFGKQRSRVGSTDKAESLALARRLEVECLRVREGLEPPGARARRAATLRPLADHVADYRAALAAKGDTPLHAARTASAILRLLADAGVDSIADLAPERIQAARGVWKVHRSARTCNHALAALKSFARWLEAVGRLERAPAGLMALGPFNERADRRLVRRALTLDEVDRLLIAAEAGPVVVTRRDGRGGRTTAELSGPERALLYRLAMGTGFRARELATLTPERFALEGAAPTITVAACYSKRGRDDVQPIRRELAERLRPWLAGRPAGVPVLAVPEKTARMLGVDLRAAGIPRETWAGVVDFHSLRVTYITHLVASGANVKAVQALARHSTIGLTMDRYCKTDGIDVRGALEGGR